METVVSQEMLELMGPLITAMQGRLVEVHLGFKKIERVIKSCTEIRNAICSWFQFTMKAVSLSEVLGGAEERPHVCSRQRN